MDEMTKLVASLGWPHIALVFGVVFIFIFREQIAAFIGRIKSVGRDGISTAEKTPEAQREKEKKQAVNDLMNVGDSLVLNEVERQIVNDLSSRGLETEGDSIKVLTRHLAATQLALDYEQIHNLIFGSQIMLLKRLNEVAGQGRNEAYVEGFFSEVQGMFSELSEWLFKDYLSFMFTRSLITVEDGNYHITNKGVDYLAWIARTGHNENRGL